MKNRLFLPLIAALLSLAAGVVQAASIGTAFTYQGRLSEGANPANGTYDFRFILYNADSGGSQVGPTLATNGITVAAGLFTTTVDFGSGVLNGTAYWLEVSVRTNGAASFVPLNPRQPLTAAPYASFAPTAGTVATGGIGASQLAPGAVNNTSLAADAVTSDKIADGAVAPADLNLPAFAGTFWSVGGNAGTSPGSDYLGTTDTQPLLLAVGGIPGWRVEPDPRGSGAANLVGGHPDNSISTNNSGGNVIAGGGFAGGGNVIQEFSNGDFIGGGSVNLMRSNVNDSVIAGGYGNIVGDSQSVIGGGNFNMTGTNTLRSVIAGGYLNNILPASGYSVIGGGSQNTVQEGSGFSVIAGGAGNLALTNADYAAIGGGLQNQIQSNSTYSAIGGGLQNSIGANADAGSIGGGSLNSIHTNSTSGTIGGGSQNAVAGFGATVGGGTGNQALRDRSTVSGGTGNFANGDSSFIGGGAQNAVYNGNGVIVAGSRNTNSGAYSIIGGGSENVISGSGFYGIIPGGRSNLVNGAYALAAGRRAQANHAGATVWADSTDADFSSTAANQFSVRATGGVRLETGGAGATLDGFPLLTGTAGPGGGFNADFLDGLDSTAFAAAAHTHYGATWTGSTNIGLDVRNTSPGPNPGGTAAIRGRQGASGGTFYDTPVGVWGEATDGFGVLGTTRYSSGAAVNGHNSSTNGAAYGVFGSTSSTSGRAISAVASATNGTTFGVHATAASTTGTGVYGLHSATTGTTPGVHGETSSTSSSAVGVLGEVSSTSPGSSSAAVRGINSGTAGSGIGVWGSHAGSGWGVHGTSVSGVGVYASTTTGNPIEAHAGGNRRFYVAANGNVFCDGAFTGGGADFAEMLPASEPLEPGDVLVIGDDGRIARCSSPGQESVVGVYSTKPAFLGGAADGTDLTGKVPVAVVGVVPVKVTGENGTIKPGNLLIASSTPGHAMKADAQPRPGTVIGKALGSFDGTTGNISMLVLAH